MNFPSSIFVFLSLSLGAVACGGTTLDTGDAAADAAPAPAADAGDGGVTQIDAGFPGPHPEVPQVDNFGGPVLTAPKVIPIFSSRTTTSRPRSRTSSASSPRPLTGPTRPPSTAWDR